MLDVFQYQQEPYVDVEIDSAFAMDFVDLRQQTMRYNHYQRPINAVSFCGIIMRSVSLPISDNEVHNPDLWRFNDRMLNILLALYEGVGLNLAVIARNRL